MMYDAATVQRLQGLKASGSGRPADVHMWVSVGEELRFKLRTYGPLGRPETCQHVWCFMAFKALFDSRTVWRHRKRMQSAFRLHHLFVFIFFHLLVIVVSVLITNPTLAVSVLDAVHLFVWHSHIFG